jgi:hypothetical protein
VPHVFQAYHAILDEAVEALDRAGRLLSTHLASAERDRIYAEQAQRFPGFAAYERQTAGVRTIPVLELRRR